MAKIELNHMPDGILAAYQSLGEKLRRSFCLGLQKNSPDFFKDWFLKAGFGKGGFQAHKVAARNTDFDKRQLDSLISKVENEEFLEELVLAHFFYADEIVKDCMNKRGEMLDEESPFEIFWGIMQSMEDRISKSHFYQLYKQLHKSIDSNFDGQTPDESRIEDPLEQIRRNLNEIDRKVRAIIDLINPLSFCGIVDKEDIISLVDNVITLNDHIVGSINQLEDGVTSEAGRFSNREDLISYIDVLEERLAEKTKSQKQQKQFSDLAEAFCIYQVKHRSEKQSEILERYLKTAIDDLRGIDEIPDNFELPGPEACEWLEWALNLHGKNLEAIQNKLKSISEDLSEFIVLCEFDWLVEKEHEKEIPEDIKSTSNGEYSEETNSLHKKDKELSFETEKQPHSENAKELVSQETPKGQSESTIGKSVSSDEQEKIENHIRIADPIPSGPIDETDASDSNHEILSVSEKSKEPAKKVSEETPTFDGDKKPDEKPPKMREKTPTQKVCKEETPEFDFDKVLATLNESEGTQGGSIVQQLDETVLELLARSESSIAYHVARLTEDLFIVSHDRFPSWAISALLLGKSFTAGMDEFVAPFQESVDHHDRRIFKNETAWTNGLSLLLGAATFRPALFAPVSGAQSVLHELRFGELTEVAGIANAIVQFGNMGVPLPRSALKKAWSIAEWEKEADGLVNETRGWLSQAGNFAIISKPGKAVWRQWISQDGPIYAILDPIIRSDEGKLNVIKEKITQWPDEIENTAKSTHRRTFRRRGDLLRPALNQILRRTLEAIGLAKRWVNLVEDNSFSEGSHNEKQVMALRQSLDIHYEPAMVELREIQSSGAPRPYVEGAVICSKSLSALYSMLNDEEEVPELFPSVNQLLNEDLLRVPEITLDDNWSPEEEPKVQLAAILNRLTREVPTFEKAFEIQCDVENHEATERIIYVFRNANAENALIEEMERKRDKLINQQRAALFRGIQESQRHLSEGLNKGLLKDIEYETWSAKLSSSEKSLKSPEVDFFRFFEVRRFFDFVSSELETMKKNEVDRILVSLSELAVTEKQKERVDSVLKQGDIYTANDYLERLRSGKELPDFETTQSGRAFFELFQWDVGGSQFSTIEKSLADQRPLDTIAAIKNRRGFRGVSMKGVPGTQARQSGEMLETWFLVKRKRRISSEQARGIFAGLGFNTIDIKLSNAGQRTWIELLAQPVQECPVSEYGSSVNGAYQVLCEWGITNEEDLLGAFSNSHQGAARIVFYFGRMTETRRRDLGRLCRKRHQTVIVLDDTLLTHLCSFRSSKLRILFECSLPFTYLSPYSVTSSLLPMEMFYGRRRQIEALISDQPNGSCILFGGRQIGKTVLLRHVERIFQNRKKGLETKFIDLKVKGIGTSRPLDDLWVILAHELAESGIIQTKVPAQASPDWLFTQIETWLKEADGRRILLLLDEADVFLESDGRDTSKGREAFSRCALIRGTMEKTNRRFKVVFSGLHNVQRATEVANNPLAQFGDPICIGPMLSNGESLEAESLITKPLSSLGYFFESSDLTARILAHTNYYPNLIQIYCHNLLVHLVDSGEGLFDKRRTPPFMITSSIIDDVYERHDLRESISDKFKLTLNLDSRFRLIAHILAYYDERNDDGLDVDWIKNEALDFWPAGFRSGGNDGRILSYDAFKNLLDEMVGLGILRRTANPGCFALRSPNVVNLLGHRNQIEEVLVSSESWEPVGEYEPGTFHAMLDNLDTAIRSPLTAVQEAALKSKENQIYLLFGNRAGGLDDVPLAISHRLGQEYIFNLEGAETQEEFEGQLQTLVSRPREGTSVVYVPPNAPWTGEWVRVAMRKAQRLRLPEATVTFLFVSDPLKSWQMFENQETNDNNVQLIELEPWSDAALKQWLEDGPFGPQQPDIRTEIRHATGNWPYLLYCLSKSTTTGVHLTDVLSEFGKDRKSKPEFRKELMEVFGLNIAKPTLVLRTLAAYGDDLAQDEIATVIENVDVSEKQDLVDRALKWAQALNLVDQSAVTGMNRSPERPKWRLNPIVYDLLNPGS
jgi:hypothetical protein